MGSLRPFLELFYGLLHLSCMHGVGVWGVSSDYGKWEVNLLGVALAKSLFGGSLHCDLCT